MPCRIASGFLFIAFACSTQAQLTDITQTPNPINAGIAKSLRQQVDAGQGDAFTPGSSIYLIKRDPARSVRRGRQLFQRTFTKNQGFGPRVNDDSIGDITVMRNLGAGLSNSCAACHGRPRGSAGFGGDVVTRPGSRDAPHLFGAGLVEMLGDEITHDLRSIRGQAVQRAKTSARSVTQRLQSKGIDYGQITVYPDGDVDTSQVQGVNPDLRVRPFFAHGASFALREFIVGAFKDEMGLESPDTILCRATDPANAVAVTSPSGMVFDPALDSMVRPPVCDRSEDGDFDLAVNEIDPAVVDHMEFYLLNYFKPGTGEVTQQSQQGLKLMERIGCTSCHVQDLRIERDRRIADVETRFDPARGIFNRLYATATTLFKIVEDGDQYPQLLPKGKPFLVENIFADFKRHDLGPAFHEREYDGSLVTEFVTEPLWGVGSTPSYGHDGRSINLEEVIMRHGGEAQETRDAFASLNWLNQRKILVFLETLVIFPPDDTASNLNPGVPGTVSPQNPSEHGSINVGALFQIPSEGRE
ncbi:MAG: di-heme oxidoredictase family protein [Gammaproteobacteria bacterium]